MAKTLCKYCCMPVGALSPSCPRCRRGWPGLKPERLGATTIRVLLFIGIAAAVALLWTPLLMKS